MNKTDWNDVAYDQDEELSFEVQELLGMLDRFEDDLADTTFDDFGDDMDFGF